jgi:hypothetical protein
MANEENLKPIRDSEVARKLQEKSVKKRKENQLKRKTFRESLLLLLEQDDTQNKINEALIAKAMNGDTKAFEVLRDTIGEKPKEEIEVTDVTNKKFDEICSQIGGDGLNE